MLCTIYGLKVGLPFRIVHFLSSRLSYQEGLRSLDHQGRPTFQDCIVSRGKPNNATRSRKKLVCDCKGSYRDQNKASQAQHENISLDHGMNT